MSPGGPELERQIDGAWKLVGLYAHRGNQRPAAGAIDASDNAIGTDASIGLAVGMQPKLKVGAEHGSSLRVLRQPVLLGAQNRAVPHQGARRPRAYRRAYWMILARKRVYS